MCILCVEIMKGKITAKEVNRALIEFVPQPDHEASLNEVIEQNYTADEIFEAAQESDEDPIFQEMEHLIPGWETLIT